MEGSVTGAALLSVLEADGKILLPKCLYRGILYRHDGILPKLLKFAVEVADLVAHPVQCHRAVPDEVFSLASQVADLPANALVFCQPGVKPGLCELARQVRYTYGNEHRFAPVEQACQGRSAVPQTEQTTRITLQALMPSDLLSQGSR